MVVLTLGSHDQDRVQALAIEAGLRVVTEVPDGYYLVYDHDILRVKDSRQGKNFSLQIDLDAELNRIMSQRLGFKKDLLCKAVGFKGQAQYRVFDGTLGFAKDATHLISFGASIVGCEQNPVTFALLKDALGRSSLLRDQMQLIYGDSYDQLVQVAPDIDCLYLDPMFENLKKKSAPKKQMAFLREINSDSVDVQRVILRGIELGLKRVVVKRPINGEHLCMKPTSTYSGKLVRYDVYTR